MDISYSSFTLLQGYLAECDTMGGKTNTGSVEKWVTQQTHSCFHTLNHTVELKTVLPNQCSRLAIVQLPLMRE